MPSDMAGYGNYIQHRLCIPAGGAVTICIGRDVMCTFGAMARAIDEVHRGDICNTGGYAKECGLPVKAAETLLSAQIDSLGAATNLIQQSFLPRERKDRTQGSSSPIRARDKHDARCIPVDVSTRHGCAPHNSRLHSLLIEACNPPLATGV